MPLEPLPFKPGFYSDDTDRDVGGMGYWKNGDKVRFFHGLPQTMGGWINDNATQSMLGTARGAIDWLSLRSERIIAFGTSSKLYIWIGGTFSDITPIRASSTINADPFSTTDTLATVVVTDTAHGALNGAFVTFSGATAVGGITIAGEYEITYIDADSYSITHSAVATSSATGGGASVVAAYQINPGAETSVQSYGWGVDSWGAGTWGTPRTVTDLIAAARTWSLDVWGEDLIASHAGGNVYVWDSSVGISARATLIAEAPTSNKAVFISQESRHLVALGADGDPMLIRWCTSEDYTDWTPTTTNTAGDARVDQGSMLVCSKELRDQTLVFTDAAVYAMQFIGPPYTFAIKPLGATEGICGPNAVAAYAGVCYWMGPKAFFLYDGTIQPLPCPVQETVFQDFNAVQSAKVWAGSNGQFDEIIWLYCSAGSDEIDRYVIYQTTEKHWVFGTMERTLFVGDSDVISHPYAVSVDGMLYYHEVGTSGAGAAIDAYIESGDIEIPQAGEQMMHIDKIIPDFKRLSDSVNLTLTAKRYPQDSETQGSGALAVTSTTKFVNPRVRGRQVSLKVESNSALANWRMGMNRMSIRPHGKR